MVVDKEDVVIRTDWLTRVIPSSSTKHTTKSRSARLILQRGVIKGVENFETTSRLLVSYFEGDLDWRRFIPHPSPTPSLNTRAVYNFET